MRYKFRAWDNVANEMLYAGEDMDVIFVLGSAGIECTDVRNGSPSGDGIDSMEHLIYMQFTGLQDREGTDIYEGDIIVHPEFYETPEYSLNGDVDGGHIIFEEGQWRLSEGGTLYEEHFSYDGNMEVVGNIYERSVKT